MDRQGGCVVEMGGRAVQKLSLVMKKTLQFIVLLSLFSFLCSYFSGFPINLADKLQFCTLIFPLFAGALDRKYMFIICNGILAFLAKNLNFGSFSLNYSGLIKCGDTELPAELEKETVEQNVVSMVCAVSPSNLAAVEEEDDDYEDIDKEMKREGIILESEEDEEEEVEDGFGEKKYSEVNDANVSTEELNQKFEEFIRKMKEEIRIEAEQQLITV